MILLMVCLGAVLGAPARYLADRAIRSRHGSAFPLGTLAVNAAGSLGLGLLIGLSRHHAIPAEVVAAAGTGFCGALTTYSTLGLETARLAEDGARRHATLNVVANLVAGIAAAALGYTAGHAW